MADDLTEKQLAYVGWRADPARDGTKTQWAVRNEVSTETLRRWEHQPWFNEALLNAIATRAVSADRIGDVLEALYTAAKDGDVQAAKSYMDYVARIAPPVKVEDRSVTDMTDEELEAAWRDGL